MSDALLVSVSRVLFFFDFEQEYEISMRNLKFVKLPYLVCIHIMNDWNYGEENWVVKFRGNK